MEDFAPVSGLIGGLLVGPAAALLLFLNVRAGGIGGIVGGPLAPKNSDAGWRAMFVAGLLLGAFGHVLAVGGAMPVRMRVCLPVLVLAGSRWASAPARVPDTHQRPRAVRHGAPLKRPIVPSAVFFG